MDHVFTSLKHVLNLLLLFFLAHSRRSHVYNRTLVTHFVSDLQRHGLLHKKIHNDWCFDGSQVSNWEFLSLSINTFSTINKAFQELLGFALAQRTHSPGMGCSSPNPALPQTHIFLSNCTSVRVLNCCVIPSTELGREACKFGRSWSLLMPTHWCALMCAEL